MFKNQFFETVIIVLAICMGLFMSLFSILVEGKPFNYSTVFTSWSMITMVILLASIFIPYKAWSAKVVGLFPVKEGSLPYKFLDNIIPSAVLNTCVTICVSAANILYNVDIPAAEQMGRWGHAIVHDWPLMFVVSYFFAFLAEYIGVKVAKHYAPMRKVRQD